MSGKIDYFDSVTNDIVYPMNATTKWWSETFVASSGYSMNSIAINIARSVGTACTVTVALYAVDGSRKPTGSALASGTIVNSAISTSQGWVVCTFSSSYTVVASTEYAIVVYTNAIGTVNWYGELTGNVYTGKSWYSTNSGSSWSESTVSDVSFRTYSGFPTGITYSKKLVAIGNNEVWYESSLGTLEELTAANGDINTSVAYMAAEAFGKVFIANGVNLKIADFTNTKITTSDIKPSGKVIPLHGDLLTGGTSGAQMVVDYIDASDSSCNVYGLRVSTPTFASGETVTGTNANGDVSFTTSAAETAPPHWYNWTVYSNNTTTYGTMPATANYVLVYRGRIGLVNLDREPQQWYLSRSFDPWDFYLLNTTSDAQRAMAGGTGDAHTAGDIILCGIPYSDDYLILGCVNEIQYMSGDPADGGSLNNFQKLPGILSSTAWCWDQSSNLYILTYGGLIRIPIGFSSAESLTGIDYPNFISDLSFNATTERLSLVYDGNSDGIIIAKTNLSTGANSGFWYDLKTKSLFKESYPVNYSIFSHYQYDAVTPTYRKLIVGCFDGYLRYYEPTEQDDNEETAIDSYVCFGPFPVVDGYKSGSISDFDIITGGGGTDGTHTDSNNLAYKIFTGETAQEVMEKIDANSSPSLAGTFYASGKKGVRDSRKLRAKWFGIRIGNSTISETWSFEKLHIGDIAK